MVSWVRVWLVGSWLVGLGFELVVFVSAGS